MRQCGFNKRIPGLTTVACCQCTHASWCRRPSESIHSPFSFSFFLFFLSGICSPCHPVVFTLSCSTGRSCLRARERQEGEDHLSVWQESVESGVWLTADNHGGVEYSAGKGQRVCVFVRWWDSCRLGCLGQMSDNQDVMFAPVSGPGWFHWSLVLLRRSSPTLIFTSSGLVVRKWLLYSGWLALRWKY